MRTHRWSLKVLCFWILASSIQMAIFISSASGEFRINGRGSALLATMTGAQEGHRILLIPTKNLGVLCTAGKVSEGKIIDPAKALLKVLFEGCTGYMLSSGGKIPCDFLSPGEPVGNISYSAVLLPGTFALLEPDGELLTMAEIHGPECPLPLENPVKGTLAGKVIVNESVKPLITFSKESQELGKAKMSFGASPAFLDMSLRLELTGAHTGMKLGIF